MSNLLRPQRINFTAGDGVPLRLTRYRGGTKGPVVLIHGASVWHGIFKLPTVEENFTQYLVRHGYDTWLVDWRASTLLPLRQFTLDEAAEHDFPAAVRRIREETGALTVQAVVHCAGSVAFFMSLASGLLPDVRGVVASQVALHHHAPLSTRVKSLLHVPELLDVGLDALSPDEDPKHAIFEGLFGEWVDLFNHECKSTVCHRLTFLFGHLYRHARLNTETHERLEEQFGPCNLTTFRHLAQMLRQGHSARYDYGVEGNLQHYGRERPPSYLDPRNLQLPITFISGDKNGTYLPVSTEETFEWLREANGPGLYRRQLLKDYGHLDVFMGSTASRDCYPVFLEALEAMA